MCQLESTPQEARPRPVGKPLCVPRIPETKPETAGFPTPRLLRSPFPGDLREDRVTSRAQSPSDRRTGGSHPAPRCPDFVSLRAPLEKRRHRTLH
ncbi:Kelch-Like Protein 3 [Manis pentadactyla]|nr:Kelch-Like Protein 3 [Manis pentadactyla]